MFWWDVPAIFELGLSGHALLVRFYLDRCADATGRAFPSLQTISEKTGISRTSVVRGIKELIDAGLLTREARFKQGSKERQSSIYTLINPEVGSEGTDPEQGKRRKSSPQVGSSGTDRRFTENQKLDPINNDSSSGGGTRQHPAEVTRLYKFWENNAAQAMSPLALAKLDSYLEDGLTVEVIEAVMAETCENNRYRMDYVYGILSRYVREGIKTLEDRKRDRLRFEDEKRQAAEAKRLHKNAGSAPDVTSEEYKQRVDAYLDQGGATFDEGPGGGDSAQAGGGLREEAASRDEIGISEDDWAFILSTSFEGGGRDNTDESLLSQDSRDPVQDGGTTTGDGTGGRTGKPKRLSELLGHGRG